MNVMDVQGSSQKKITRIHTFESDVAQARLTQGIANPVTPIVVPTEKQSTYAPPVTNTEKPEVPLPAVTIAQSTQTFPTPTPVITTEIRQKQTIPPVQNTPKVAVPLQTPPPPVETKDYSMISKEIAGAVKTPAPSILSDTTDPYDGEALSSGTVISDTRRKRFKLFPAILSAVTSWFSSTKEAYEASKIPVNTIVKAEKRIETIVKAAAQSEQAPKDDFKKVAEHLKTVERKQIHSTLMFRDKESVPAPTWESANDSVETKDEPLPVPAPLLQPEVTREVPKLVDTPEPEPLPLPEVTQMLHEPVLTEREKLVEVVPEVVPVVAVAEPIVTIAEDVEVNIPVTAVESEPTVFAPAEPEEIIETLPEKKYTEPVAVVEPIPVPAFIPEPAREVPYTEVAEMPPVQNAVQSTRYAPPRTDRSSYPFYALISVILIASFSGIAFSYYLFAGKGSSVTTLEAPVYEVPKLIQAQDNTSFVLTDNRNELLQTLLANLNTADTVTQMYPTVTEGGTSKPAPVEAVVAVLAPRAPGSFTRSIKEITFGSTGNAEPFIIIKSTSFDVAFAGMLNWETMMSADLVPLFGETVTETFDPQARTATGTREAFFKDVIASNKNARVLLDENGDDRIVYTFTDQNTILITTNREALAELIGLVN
jgi:hypothetical protein